MNGDKGFAAALGYFDGVHLGHRHVIRCAVSLAQQLALAPAVFTFTTDVAVPPSKQGKPQILSFPLRRRALLALGVEEVFAPAFQDICGMSGREFVQEYLYKTLRVRAVSCGADYRFGLAAACGLPDLQQLAAAVGIEVRVADQIRMDGLSVSATHIRELVQAGEVAAAAELLGRPFLLELPVQRGRGIGHTVLAMPTINQVPPPCQLLPRFGVYATAAYLDGKAYPSVTNVGVRPTLHGGDRPVVESYLMGAGGDLYGKTVQLAFLQFIRPEQVFPDAGQLRAQMARDAATAEKIGKTALQSALFMV